MTRAIAQNGSIALRLLLVLVLAGALVVGWRMAHRSPPRVAAATQHSVTPPNVCQANAAGKLLLVSISRQRLWACDGRALLKQSAVTTGATKAPNGVDDATPLGSWHIYEKFRDLALKGSDANGPWDDYVQYWLPFDTAVGFHDASWQTFPFGSSQYQTDGSHGCVQLPTDVAAWVYAWAPVGTTVTVEA